MMNTISPMKNGLWVLLAVETFGFKAAAQPDHQPNRCGKCPSNLAASATLNGKKSTGRLNLISWAENPKNIICSPKYLPF